MTPREKRFIDEKFADADIRADAYRRLEEREPLAYILGEWYFYDRTYYVTPDVLIPQPDTELLVETAIKLIPSGARFLDLCTGSGCIAISVLCHRPDLTALAVDISQPALEIAERNASLNSVRDRIDLLQADICSENLPALTGTGYGALLSNPPYIASEVIAELEPEVRAEPSIALDGGDDGLRFYRAIKSVYGSLLADGAPVLLEIGYDQSEAVRAIFGGGEVKRDYGGNDRLLIFRHNKCGNL